MNRFTFGCIYVLALVTIFVPPALSARSQASKPVKVVIEAGKAEAPDRLLPLDPMIRANYEYTGSMSFGVSGEGGKRLTCGAGSANTCFKINGQIWYPDNFNAPGFGKGMPGAPMPPPVPAKIGQKPAPAMQVSSKRGELKFTMTLEVVAGRPYLPKPDPTKKRRMDTVLIKYLIENNDTKPHQVGIRLHIDTMCGNNDGCVFASPTLHPNTILDGRLLKDKEVPEFIEMLEQPNLQNPGFKGVFTCKVGNKLEGPDRVVLTNLGVFGDWEIPAVPAMGDSAAAFYWEPKEIKPKSQREAAFAIGQGIACPPESEGLVTAQFGGSFEPNSECTITAYVDDPFEGQSLMLELPKGMVRTLGKELQSVPMAGDNGQSIVMWKARVLELGDHAVRIRSSNGASHSWTVKISRPD